MLFRSSVLDRADGQLEFETIPGQDPRPEVARAVVNAGYSLLEMRAAGGRRSRLRLGHRG